MNLLLSQLIRNSFSVIFVTDLYQAKTLKNCDGFSFSKGVCSDFDSDLFMVQFKGVTLGSPKLLWAFSTLFLMKQLTDE